MNVQLGMVGLGRMGSNMARRLLRGGHDVVAFDVDPDSVARISTEGAIRAGSLQALIERLDPPRVVWVMVPAGDTTQTTLDQLRARLDPGDVIVNGGNSRYTDSVNHCTALAEDDISFVDAGTSGGVWGLDNGYTLMVGADPDVFDAIEPVLATLAPENGYARVGPPGAGHFVKMVHNGVEYALMQAYAEGFELLRASDFKLDVAEVAQLWRNGSVVRSWLLDLAASALAKDPDLEKLSGWVEDSGEGRWTLEEGIRNSVPLPALAAALFARFSSRESDAFSNRMLAALRQEFGGHPVHGVTGDAA
jgi:6-phosphogluconate dehydrogenase